MARIMFSFAKLFKTSKIKMKQIVLTIAALLTFTFAQAQTQIREYGAFKKESELKSAFQKFDMSAFTKAKVLFVCDTLEKEASLAELNELMKTYIPIPKKSEVKKASETNNGWVQTFGIYKGDDALMYVRFSISPETEKLEEVFVEKN